MKVVILAGGGGTRLYPLSNEEHPKQFLCLEDDQSLLMHTLRRFLGLVSARDLLILTNARYESLVREELVKVGAEAAHVLLEPCRRNTAPAVALAALYCRDELHCPEDEVIVVAPADAVIRPAALLYQSIYQAERIAKNQEIVIFGVRPDRPETGYGYIEIGNAYGAGYTVRSFKEKPDRKRAESYLSSGNYYWNAGMFTFSLATVFREFSALAPDIAQFFSRGYQAMLACFGDMPDVSLDYAIAEKSQHIKVLPLACYWNDLGSWDALYDVLEKDDAGNVCRTGGVTLSHCSHVLALTDGKPVIGIGLENLIVVDTKDALLIVRRGQAQEVKRVLQERSQGETV